MGFIKTSSSVIIDLLFKKLKKELQVLNKLIIQVYFPVRLRQFG